VDGEIHDGATIVVDAENDELAIRCTEPGEDRGRGIRPTKGAS
jgi:hypothetical protein